LREMCAKTALIQRMFCSLLSMIYPCGVDLRYVPGGCLPQLSFVGLFGQDAVFSLRWGWERREGGYGTFFLIPCAAPKLGLRYILLFT
jgi:hypothetical protein